MNERIFQLVGQAISEVPFPMDFNKEHAVFAEKFAELIVRECNNRANQYISDCGEVASLPDRILEEHFGVK